MLIPIELRSGKKHNLTFFSKVSLPAHSLFQFNLPFPEKKTLLFPFMSLISLIRLPVAFLTRMLIPQYFKSVNHVLLRAQLVFSSSIVLPRIFCPFKPIILVTSTLFHLLENITVMIISTALIDPIKIVCMTSPI